MHNEFTPGQPLVWLHRRQTRRYGRCWVDVKVVQVCRLRIRIRIDTLAGAPAFRWVKPENLRGKEPDEPFYPYPVVEAFPDHIEP